MNYIKMFLNDNELESYQRFNVLDSLGVRIVEKVYFTSLLNLTNVSMVFPENEISLLEGTFTIELLERSCKHE